MVGQNGLSPESDERVELITATDLGLTRNVATTNTHPPGLPRVRSLETTLTETPDIYGAFTRLSKA
jgi:hypothetical protein